MNFADPIDEAAEREKQMIEIALANRSKPRLIYTGACQWCEDAIDSGQFCSPECRDDHAKMVWAIKQMRPL